MTLHVYAPSQDVKSIVRAVCPDCGKRTAFVGMHTPWHGWDETCIGCGRHWQDGEWMPLNFERAARRKSIERAKAAYRRSTATSIRRTVA